MRLLVNFAMQKMGGGQTVACNFFHSVTQAMNENDTVCFAVAKGTMLEKEILDANGMIVFRTSQNPIKRILKELIWGRRLIKREGIQCIYSYFGVGMYPKKTPQVVGTADSNIFFPEIDFWEGYQGLALIKRKLIDHYRIRGLERAKGIIFENEEMLLRYNSIYANGAKGKYIAPSIEISSIHDLTRSPHNAIQCLFLCGWQRNKNIFLIPEIIKQADELGVVLEVTLTAPRDDSEIMKEFVLKARELNVADRIVLPGVIERDQLESIYCKTDYVMLLSQLESFSNSIIEAWTFHRVIIISDMAWAHSICGDAACYVDRNSPLSIVRAICSLQTKNDEYQKIVDSGEKKVRLYPTPVERAYSELAFIKDVIE